MGDTYTMQGDYCLPNLTLFTQENAPSAYDGNASYNT